MSNNAIRTQQAEKIILSYGVHQAQKRCFIIHESVRYGRDQGYRITRPIYEQAFRNLFGDADIVTEDAISALA